MCLLIECFFFFYFHFFYRVIKENYSLRNLYEKKLLHGSISNELDLKKLEEDTLNDYIQNINKSRWTWIYLIYFYLTCLVLMFLKPNFVYNRNVTTTITEIFPLKKNYLFNISPKKSRVIFGFSNPVVGETLSFNIEVNIFDEKLM